MTSAHQKTGVIVASCIITLLTIILWLPGTASAAASACPLNGRLNTDTGACTAPSGIVYVYAGDSAPTGFGCAQGFSLWQIQSGGTVGGGSMLDPATGNSYQCFNTDDGSASTEPPTGKGKVVTPGTTSCEGATNQIINLPVCIFRAAMAGLGSVLITLSAWLLQVAGIVFNWLLYYTVVAFGAENGFLTPKVLDAINATWTVFRDIANILIIGLFTFIAISTILGNHEFGAKKMLAKALIIAVLINFSLLFTKMIIDGSNFFAYQFYNAAGGLKGNSASPVGELSSTQSVVTDKAIEFKQDGIAGKFINYLGVTSIGNTFNTLKTGADNVNNGWVAILHGVFSATLLLGVALVLLYGSFLLVSRAILIVFLLITSSLAFASYLLPVSMQGSYGWGTWWNSLLKSALFAPLLMMFLWVTMSLADKLRPAEGSLGALINDPTNAGNMSALFGYIIILGLLFASFKLSSSFATSITGFNFAAMIPALGLGAIAGIGGFLGRQTVGRAGLGISQGLQNRSKTTDNAFAKRMYDFGAQRFKGVAGRDFNLMRTGFGAAVAGTAGKKVDDLVGKELKGFEGTQKAFLKRTGEAAQRMALSADEKKEIKEKGIDQALKENAGLAQHYAESEKAQKENEELVKVLGRDKDATAQSFGEAIKDLETKLITHERTRDALTAGTSDHGEATRRVAETERELAETRRRANEQMREQGQRIKEASAATQRAGRMFKDAAADAETAARATGKIPAAAYKDVGDIAKENIQSSLTAMLLHSTGLTSASRAKLATKGGKEAGKMAEQHRFKEKYGDAFKEMTKDDHAAEHKEEKPSGAPAAHTPAPEEHTAPPSPGGGHGRV
ncbi:MAG: hypothetical protein AAB480_01065 [Patescibacteria group bacterium]